MEGGGVGPATADGRGVGFGVGFGVIFGVAVGPAVGVGGGDGGGMTEEPTVQRPPAPVAKATNPPLNWQLPIVIGGPKPLFVRFPTASI